VLGEGARKIVGKGRSNVSGIPSRGTQLGKQGPPRGEGVFGRIERTLRDERGGEKGPLSFQHRH